VSDFATAHSAQVTLAQAIVSAAQSVPGQVTQIVVGDPPAAEADIKVDLREALSVVIETEEERVDAAADLSHDDVSELEQRRLDLVMWLLNLESRLAPYCADFA
jgi:hypothetical protein